MEFTLLAAALSGVLAAWLGVKLLQRNGRLVAVEKPTDVLIGAAAVGVFSGRIIEMITAGVNPIANPFDILLIRGGVDSAAATIASVGVVAWTFRADLRVLDQMAPAALAGLAGWHAGCLWTGACLGTATGSSIGFTLTGSDVPRHPTELYAAALLLVAAVLVVRLPASIGPTGTALAAAGVVRLITEPLRPSIGGGPIVWYWAAVGAGLALAVIGLDRGDGHGDPTPGTAFDDDRAAMSFDDAAGDGQSKPRPAGA